ncbi:ABC transporter permease [Aureimonas leprariae]|uniref:ABC transporter permease n=1 Tax=Plantimonas leprariae TaxID=2615207 RepID=A0A7V7PS58_9HYPH|nr:ABC transporter permease [Aureimonas leprariae]KAB0681890.1 ABC transporter permease [Aureimonas leprariae]
MSALAPPAPPRPRPRPRIAGIIVLGLWLLLGLGLVWTLIQAYDPELMARYAPLYMSGLRTTITLVLISFVVGAILSIPIALGRTSANGLARGLTFSYVYFFRGTPLIAQIFLVYYGIGQFRGAFETVGLWWFFRDAWYCALFSLSLNTAAYQAEILRGSIMSVPRGQWEGARSLGLPGYVTFSRVILPQAMIVALRPYANEIILMVKASAIVAIITVLDLFGETRRAYSRTFDFQTYLWAAVLYLAIVEILRHATNFAERRLIRHLKR